MDIVEVDLLDTENAGLLARVVDAHAVLAEIVKAREALASKLLSDPNFKTLHKFTNAATAGLEELLQSLEQLQDAAGSFLIDATGSFPADELSEVVEACNELAEELLNILEAPSTGQTESKEGDAAPDCPNDDIEHLCLLLQKFTEHNTDRKASPTALQEVEDLHNAVQEGSEGGMSQDSVQEGIIKAVQGITDQLGDLTMELLASLSKMAGLIQVPKDEASSSPHVARKAGAEPPTKKQRVDASVKVIPPPQWDTKRVFFATNRNFNQESLTNPKKSFYGEGTNKTGQLEYGMVTVTIPRKVDDGTGSLVDRRPGDTKAGDDPVLHITISRDSATYEMFYGNQDDFWQNEHLETELDKTKHEALLYIHGYNVTFAAAVRTAGQLAFDLGGESGLTAIAFDWASYGNVLRYYFPITGSDTQRAHESAELLPQFLDTLLQKVERVHIIAHSMGNMVLLEALQHMKRNKPLREMLRVPKSVTFAAPDLPRPGFRELLNLLQELSIKYLTLYCSDGDMALATSSWVRLSDFFRWFGNSEQFRAGYFDIGHDPHPIFIDGLDTVDASGFAMDWFGHGYFSNSKQLITDMAALIRDEHAANHRATLQLAVYTRCRDFRCEGKVFKLQR